MIQVRKEGALATEIGYKNSGSKTELAYMIFERR